jgi:cell division protein ZapA
MLFEIKLEIAGKTYALPMEQGDEDEEHLVRKAAERVREYIIRCRHQFGEKGAMQDMLAITALQLAREVVSLERKNDMQPLTNRIQQWTDEIEKYLKIK